MLVKANFTVNLATNQVREESLDGRAYLVVPMVMMTEGVHEGSDGPGYYPGDELSDAVPAWNHKPIVRYHPEVDGKPVSAADVSVLNERIGFVLNTSYESPKQKAEAWFDVLKTKEKDERIYTAIVNRQKMELSTGLFLQQEKTRGTWNSESYEWVARRHKPDHLAVLPDKIGACSIADGAGLFANEASFQQTSAGVRKALAAKYGDPGEYWYGYVEDVYPDFVVFCDDNVLMKISYKVSRDGVVTLTGDAVEVVRVTTYQTKNGTVIGNSKALFVPLTEVQMNKNKPLVDQIIANSGGDWTEKDREFLMGKDEKFLQKLATPVQNTTPPPAPTLVPAPAPTPTPAPIPSGQQTAMALNEWLATAPKEVQTVVIQGLNSLGQQRANLISKITANSTNPFSVADLQAMDPQTLEKLAKFAEPVPVENHGPLFPFPMPNQVPQFLGAMPPAPNPAPIGNAGNPADAPPVLSITPVNYEELVSNRRKKAL